jgi:hypothetical protein
VLESIVQDTPEIGLQVAAYLDGKLVVDAWAGNFARPIKGCLRFRAQPSTVGRTTGT